MGCMRPYFKKTGGGGEERRNLAWGQDGSRVLGSEDMFCRPHCSRHPVSPLDPTMLCRLPIPIA